MVRRRIFNGCEIGEEKTPRVPGNLDQIRKKERSEIVERHIHRTEIEVGSGISCLFIYREQGKTERFTG